MKCLANNGFSSEKSYELLLLESSISMDDCIKGESIMPLEKTNKVGLLKITVALILRYGAQLNTYEKLTSDQAIVMASDLIEIFKYETLEDLVLIFKMARQGKFGYKSRFDISVVTTWIPTYLEIKAKQREENYQKEKNNRLVFEKQLDEVIHIDTLNKMKNMVKKLEDKDKTPKNKKLKSTDYNNYQQWLKGLPKAVQLLSSQEIKKEMNKCIGVTLKNNRYEEIILHQQEYNIYNQELKQRMGNPLEEKE